MKKIALLVLIFFIPFVSRCQIEQYDEIKMNVIENKQSLPGTSIIIENIKKWEVYNTDFYGAVTFKMPKTKNHVRLSFMGPVVRINILRPTDSIIVNLDTRRVQYYFQGKRMKKRKIKIRKP